MKKILPLSFLFILLISTDQYIKTIFVGGFEQRNSCLSFVLAYNYGVAFSMFSFLEENLKYIQIALLVAGTLYLYFNKEVFRDYKIAIIFLYAGGVTNILDRFTYGAVVDYIYWHCYFNFAIFNLADIFINIAVILIIFKQILIYLEEKKNKKKNKKKNT